MDLEYWHMHRPDTLTPLPFYRPAQREAVEAARNCAARFSIDKTPARDLLGLGQAYLGAEQLSQADSAFRRWLALLASRPAGDRRWALVQIVNAYLDARPAYLIQAGTYIHLLDAMGPSAAPQRMMAHLAVMPLARHMDSVPLEAVHVTAAIRASREMRGDTAVRYLGLSVNAYVWLTDLYGRQGEVAQALRMLDSAEVELRKWCGGVRFEERGNFTRPSWGQPAPPLQVTRWFNDSTGGRRPALGRRSLIFFIENAECSDVTCFAKYAMLRRLIARYPDLDVTYVVATHGAYHTQLLGPEEEMALDRRQLFDEHKLPGALAIWQTTARRRAVDHGLEEGANPNEEDYRTAMGSNAAVLIDRRGIVRMVYQFSPETEIRWQNVIGELP